MAIPTRDESDHFPLCVTLKGKGEWRDRQTNQNKRVEAREILMWDREKGKKFTRELGATWAAESVGQDGSWEQLEEDIWKAAREAGMVKRVNGRSRKRVGWFNRECEAHRKLLRSKLKNWLNNKERGEAWEEWKSEKKEYMKRCKEAKDEWLEKKWETVESSREGAQFWKAIRQFRPSRTGSRAGSEISPESWINHFKGLLGEEAAQTRTVERKGDNNELGDIGGPDDVNRDLSWQEFTEGMTKMKTGKAAGSDGIKAEFLKSMQVVGKKKLFAALQGM